MRNFNQLLAFIPVLAVCLVLGTAGCSDDHNLTGGGDTGGGDTGGGDTGGGNPAKSVSFTSTQVVWSTPNNVIWIESSLSIIGYAKSTRLTVGGYWFRKGSDGKYRFVTASCNTNVPNNRLGHQFLIPVPNNSVTVRSQQFAASDYSCFKDKTGKYYGRIFLYNSKSIGINPNSSTIARSKWVAFSWGSSGSSANTIEPQIHELSIEEIREIEDNISRNASQNLEYNKG